MLHLCLGFTICKGGEADVPLFGTKHGTRPKYWIQHLNLAVASIMENNMELWKNGSGTATTAENSLLSPIFWWKIAVFEGSGCSAAVSSKFLFVRDKSNYKAKFQCFYLYFGRVPCLVLKSDTSASSLWNRKVKLFFGTNSINVFI